MAEYCEECFKEMFKELLEGQRPVLSVYKDLCEGCAQYKRVVVRVVPVRKPLWPEIKKLFSKK